MSLSMFPQGYIELLRDSIRAQASTYTLVAEVECYSVKGRNSNIVKWSYRIKMKLTAINAKLINIEGNIE